MFNVLMLQQPIKTKKEKINKVLKLVARLDKFYVSIAENKKKAKVGKIPGNYAAFKEHVLAENKSSPLLIKEASKLKFSLNFFYNYKKNTYLKSDKLENFLELIIKINCDYYYDCAAFNEDLTHLFEITLKRCTSEAEKLYLTYVYDRLTGSITRNEKKFKEVYFNDTKNILTFLNLPRCSNSSSLNSGKKQNTRKKAVRHHR